MRKVLRVIDSISEWTGRTARWLWVLLVLVMTYEVTMRYVFDAPSMWAFETSAFMGTCAYTLAWAYVHKHRAHVRVDVFYTRLSPRGKAIIDVVGTLLLFLPLLILFIGVSVDWAWRAWVVNEKSVETYWYPPIAPVRTVVAIGFCLFAFQAVAQFIRDLYILVRNKAYD